jgi:small GTP-binding protein
MNELLQTKPILKNKIVLLGDVFVGKTSISVRFSKNEFQDVQESTSGAVFVTHTVEAEKYLMQFDIWDTAGQERFKALGKNISHTNKIFLNIQNIFHPYIVLKPQIFILSLFIYHIEF